MNKHARPFSRPLTCCRFVDPTLSCRRRDGCRYAVGVSGPRPGRADATAVSGRVTLVGRSPAARRLHDEWR